MHEAAELELPTQENFQTDLRSVFQGAIRVALELILEEEIREMVGARRFERAGQRIDHRNGTYLRRLPGTRRLARAASHARIARRPISATLGAKERRDELRRSPKSIEAGFDAHVAKPPDLAQIERLLA
jgi:hypothetical protein